MVKLGYTITYVTDVEKTLVFFENAFGIARRFRTPENTYGELETGIRCPSGILIELCTPVGT